MSAVRLSTILQAGDDDRPVLHRRTVSAIVLHHEINRQTQLATAMSRDSLTKRPVDDLRIVDDTSDVVSSTHQPLVFSRLSVHVLRENLHHVFLRVAGLVIAAVSVLWYVESTVVVKESQHIASRRPIYH